MMWLWENNLEVFKTGKLLLITLTISLAIPLRTKEGRRMKLTQLSTSVPTEAVQMTAISQRKSVSFSARYSYNFLIHECLNLLREWLIRFII
jgi:hypothetical protein